MDVAYAEVPDVLFLDPDEAARLLSEAGFTFRVVETRSPRNNPHSRRFRVVRVRADAPYRVELTVCEV
jgi:transposase